MNHQQVRSITVGTTSILLFEENKKRKACLIYNNSANIVELITSKDANYGSGIPIAANGGVFSDDHYNCQGRYYLIAAGAGSDVRVLEIIAEKGE